MPRRSSLLVLCSLISLCVFGCKTVSSETRDPARTITSDSPKNAPVVMVDAGASAPTREEPLAWGTRAAAQGPLWPVVDGMCIHGEIWPTKGSALYSYGNGTGPWTRGDTATVARLVDDGLELVDVPTPGKGGEEWGELAPIHVEGKWPGPLFVYSLDGGGGRMREWPSIWTRLGADAGGFKLAASHRESGAPNYDRPTIFRGNLVTTRRDEKGDGFGQAVFKALPFEEGAASVANLPALGRKNFSVQQLGSNDTALFAVGTIDEKGYPQVLRMLADGKVKELPLPEGRVRIVATRPNLLLAVEGSRLLRLVDDKLVPVTLPAATTILAVAATPQGDLWILPESRKSVLVARAGGAGDKVDELVIPAPASPRPQEAVMHWPTSGSSLAGVEVDDPYVIGDRGSLFHFEDGKWLEVVLPEPPFASTGKYQAQAVVVPAKGDLYVNAGYAEKGLGWKTPERYRAVLRNRRPKEILRCNEPHSGANHSSGHGFMSFPPIADDACASPFVVLLRIAYDVNEKTAAYVFDRKSDYPSIREAIKATPSLGFAVDLVELVSGSHRYLGARVPNAAAGRELAQAVAKRVVGYAETRPEVVCGTPKEERVIHVDVATGKVAAQ